ncbi:hypothetical protein SAMD00019534_003240 [Acytostelium subglobosum LB1]|uniref:hypothetical protein n=1 Tax=Acytostelium subglobosum LB1 TaxID=1410327 RepID=UPI000644DCD0|nr:hypothetical protein SAMD00019534_003240 [Acytostelium subglobosum LB1]GAM17149.1 hypothetical protein SAMD00019534_003240 [Acytostelium subglobosum LB1]|eukprot:XP_012759211.1 hypothetical protein SAMD00019534_003240 [Acytostelium subglobosum LB1]
MDKIFEIGNSMFEAASEKINTLNLAEKKRYLSERAGNMLGVSGNVYEINGRRYTERTKIAEGGFGLVYLVRDDYNKEYALKRMFVHEKERLHCIQNEINVMRSLKHNRNIVRLEEHKISENREKRETEVLMLLEFCSGGSVLDIMNNRGERNGLSEREILAIFADTVCAVMELHNQNPPIAHRDLKIENILYCENSGCYKLCDFGSATTKVFDCSVDTERVRAEDDINTFTTLFYRAPEMVDLYQRQLINEKVDIWALGCLLFKMAFFVDPFESSLAIMNIRYQIPNNSRFSPAFHSLIEYLLTPDPTQRPSIHDVMGRVEEMRGGGSGGARRKGLQTFSNAPRSGGNNPQRPLSQSDPSTRPMSNNSTPSYQSPSTSNTSSPASTPTPSRKQNLFDMVEWNDNGSSSSGQSTSSQSSSRQQQSQQQPQQQQQQPKQSLIDDFDWTPKGAVSSPPATQQQRGLGGSAPQATSNNNTSSFKDEFDDFISAPSTANQQKKAANIDEISFDKIDLFTATPSTTQGRTQQQQQQPFQQQASPMQQQTFQQQPMQQQPFQRPQQPMQQPMQQQPFQPMFQQPQQQKQFQQQQPQFQQQQPMQQQQQQKQQPQQQQKGNDFDFTWSSVPAASTTTATRPMNSGVNNTQQPQPQPPKDYFDQLLKPTTSNTGGPQTPSNKSTGAAGQQSTTSPSAVYSKPNYNIDLNSYSQTNGNGTNQPNAANSKTNKNPAFNFNGY